MASLGSFLLLACFVICSYAAVISVIGARRGSRPLIESGIGAFYLVAAGLLDPERTRPSATYPCDLFFGRSYNPFIDKHLDVNAGWHPPARWTDCIADR